MYREKVKDHNTLSLFVVACLTICLTNILIFGRVNAHLQLLLSLEFYTNSVAILLTWGNKLGEGVVIVIKKILHLELSIAKFKFGAK